MIVTRLVCHDGTQPSAGVNADNVCLQVMPVQLDEKSLSLWRHTDTVDGHRGFCTQEISSVIAKEMKKALLGPERAIERLCGTRASQQGAAS